ncbi:MAG: hydantoinase/oxoprolinase family protein [Erysipelotrichaceae bacterium]|nr:hydantoinase/oxoprolinase family protein [Erysipelotrichaceae bacterium]
MKVRIGIDVGGTFTDAAVINNDTYELIGSIKVPTTHSAAEGVAAGIVDVLNKIMTEYDIKPQDVHFIAHGTTQATNALLEGDVAKVGILTLGSGFEGMKSKSDTFMGDIELAPNKFLITANEFVQLKSNDDLSEKLNETINQLIEQGCESLVAAEAFSVDNPENENKVVMLSKEKGVPATATSDISKLYGLKVRTRTAVVNASILPKMLETANMTESSIKNAGIESPLMVMRCDGGVMNVEEVRNRPILTILSGPAAGVAGALMYEKLTDGIFFEVGGTSTDISCVKDGKVMVKYAEVGGHKTYLNSLDVRTVGIGGGSMVQIKDSQAVDSGPRSAHIAGLDYDCYGNEEDVINPVLKTIRPKPSDPEYGYVECSNGKRFCFTVAGAANILGYVKESDYAYGNVETAKKVWKPLAEAMNLSIEEVAKKVLYFAAVKNSKVVNDLVKDYNLDVRTTTFIGGGGGAAAVVPHLAQHMGFKQRIAKNAPVISTIGVALAMVREMVERVIAHPSEEDILSVRREAEVAVVKAGASPETVEIQVEVDTQRNVVRATAIGTTEMRSKDLLNRTISKEAVIEIVADNLNVSINDLVIEGETELMFAVIHKNTTKKFGFFKSVKNNMRLVDNEGVIRLQKNNANVRECLNENAVNMLKDILNEYTEYNDGGAQLPNIYIIAGKKIIDVSGLSNEGQVLSLASVELKSFEPQTKLIMISTNRADV